MDACTCRYMKESILSHTHMHVYYIYVLIYVRMYIYCIQIFLYTHNYKYIHEGLQYFLNSSCSFLLNCFIESAILCFSDSTCAYLNTHVCTCLKLLIIFYIYINVNNIYDFQTKNCIHNKTYGSELYGQENYNL